MTDTSILRRYAEVPAITDARLAPDANSVAYTVVEVEVDADIRSNSIWVSDLQSYGESRRLVSDAGSNSLPRWHPSGTLIAFANRLTDGVWSVRQVHVETGTVEVLAVHGVEAIEDLEWSPDGQYLAYSARVPDPACYHNGRRKVVPVDRAKFATDGAVIVAGRRRHLFLVQRAEPGHSRQITGGDFEDEGIAWSPDSQRIAFTSARDEDWDLKWSADTYVVDIQDGRLVKASAHVHTGPPWGDSHLTPAWSPDGSRIACIVTPDQHHPHWHGLVAAMGAAGGAPRILSAKLDRNARSRGTGRGIQWTPDGILFLLDDRGAVHLYRVRDAEGSSPEPVVTGQRQIRAFDCVLGTTALVSTDITHPGILSVISRGSERVIAAYGGGSDIRDARRFVAINPDGQEVEAWAIEPEIRYGERPPAVLHVHGGPNFMDGYRYSPEKQALAADGYFVMFSNPRGSTGYAESWARAVRGRRAAVDPGLGFGEPVLADLLAVVNQAVREFGIDSERVGVTGTSYGGFMTAWTLGATDRFRAGVCVNPSINLATIIWRGDGFVVPWLSGQLGVDVIADPAEVIRNSAISVASGISAPILLLHAEDDKGCPIEQSEQLFIRLRHWGKVARMIRFPNSSHVIASPYQLRERLRFTLEWFDNYVRHAEPRADVR